MQLIPSREQLVFYIYELGFDGACSMFHLSKRKVNSILYQHTHKIKANEPSKADCTRNTLKQDNINHLFRVLKANYKQLRKVYLGLKDLDRINKYGNSAEDIFHNAILKLVEDSQNFIYKDDNKTLAYIKVYLFNQTLCENKRNTRNKTIFEPVERCLELI
jgi:hypothetical protein